jgi:hypothetical protein
MGVYHQDRLSELADYRKIKGTAMFLQYSKPAGYLGQTKVTDGTWKERESQILLPVFSHW